MTTVAESFGLRRGQVAAAADVSIETLRCYEPRGLLPPRRHGVGGATPGAATPDGQVCHRGGVFRLLGLLGGLSVATDLGTGAPVEEWLKRSLVAVRLARADGGARTHEVGDAPLHLPPAAPGLHGPGPGQRPRSGVTTWPPLRAALRDGLRRPEGCVAHLDLRSGHLHRAPPGLGWWPPW